jgi:hypothetical protein
VKGGVALGLLLVGAFGMARCEAEAFLLSPPSRSSLYTLARPTAGLPFFLFLLFF